MNEIALVSAALGKVETSAEIAKALLSTGLAGQRAELNLKLTALLVSLSAARTELADIQDELRATEARVVDLEEACLRNGPLVPRGCAVYRCDATGEP